MSNKDYNLSGRITNRIDIPMENLRIKVIKTNPLNSDSGKEIKSDIKINSDGTYNLDLIDNFDKNALVLKVVDNVGKELFTNIHNDVQENNKLNIEINHDVVSTAKVSLASTIKLIDSFDIDLKTINNEGIAFLADKTKLSLKLVSNVLEAKATEVPSIPIEFNIALLKRGIKKEDLFTLPIYESMEIYRTEIEKDGSKIETNELKKIEEAVLAESTKKILARRNSDSISSVGEMLDLTTTDLQEKAKIVKILFHSNDEESVKEKKLEAELSSKMIEDFKLNRQLGVLTFNNAPLIRKLKNEVKTVEGLVDIGLYEEKKLTKFVKGIIEQKKQKAYIRAVTEQLEKEFPERIMAKEIQDGNINIKDQEDVINEILKKPSFKLAQKGISHYEKDFEKIKDKKERTEVKNEFGKLNRLFSLTNNRVMMKTLLDNGFDSAFKIVGTGQNSFLNTFKKEDKEEAKVVFKKSEKKRDMITHLWTANQTTGHMPMPHVISAKGVKENPDLEELFGNLDFCSCGHCESVLSPAAYLVDLLEFLKDDGVVTKLLAKRPDIEHIELTCANTETVLPYIDLVNEVLEYWVVNSNLNEFKGNNVTNESSASLLAEPVHVQDKAYAILANETFPLTLPFDRNKQLEQNFLSAVGTSRLEILNLFSKVPIDDKVMIQEKLNMNETLYNLFTGEENHTQVSKLYGFSEGTNLNEKISNAKLFCHHLNIEYQELITLLKVSFINPSEILDKTEIKISLIYKEATNTSTLYKCNFFELKLSHYEEDNNKNVKLTSITDSSYLKLILFIRLWKHIGWSIEEIDLLLGSLEQTPLLNDFFSEALLKITIINELKELLSFSDNRNLSFLLTLLNVDVDKKEEILASVLKINVESLEEWIILVGIEPFKWEDGKPLIIDFLKKMKDLQSVGVKLSELNYLFRHIDKTGKSKITIDEIMSVRNLIFEKYKSIEELGEKNLEQVNEEKKVIENKVNTIKTLAKEVEVLTLDIEKLNTENKTDEAEVKEVTKQHKTAELSVKQRDEKSYEDRLTELNIQIETENKLIETLKESTISKVLSEYLQSDIQMIELLLKRIPLIENGFLISENDIIVKYSNKISRNPDSLIKKEKIENINFGEEKNFFPEKTDSNADYVAASFSFFLKRSENQELLWEASSNLVIEIKIDDEVQKHSEKILIEANRVYSINIIVSNIRNKDDFFKFFYRIEEEEEKKILSNKREYGQLLKSLQWINTMDLSLLEVDYFMTEDSIKKIPLLEDINDTAYLSFLISKVLTISKYQHIKKELNISNDDLVKFLLNPSEKYLFEQEKYSAFYKFISSEKEDGSKIFKYDTEKLETLTIDKLLKYTELFRLSQNSGLSIDNLLKIANEKLTVEKLKDTLKTKYDSDSWLKLLKNTYNPIRTAQRDALVSYVLHKLKSNETTDHINTQDKLFEYFLIDVAMDSCMKTSRIKQAISSVQLFIQRCLYNLENVSPSSINLEKWEWAKNYRVWEANRKLFLYPENWLDPSLRSTKTPFFKELEGELLQSDINEDLATKALLTYLEKVDRVSHLEVCGMCKEDQSERIHVIGRTSGIKRVYYHRVYDGTWSPWEQVVLDLEDGPVIPVFWKGRLFLYWTTILPKGEMPSKNSDQTISSDDLKNYIEVNLNWSEYYNNKWQEKRTSDFNEPIIIFLEDAKLNKNNLKLEYLIDEENLLIGISKNEIYYGHYIFYNTQSLPKNNQTLEKGQTKKNILDKIDLLNNDITSLKKEQDELNLFSISDSIQYFSIQSDIIIKEQAILDLFNDLDTHSIQTTMVFLSKKQRFTNKDILLKNNFYSITDFSTPVDQNSNNMFFVSDNNNTFFVNKGSQILNPLVELIWMHREMYRINEENNNWNDILRNIR